MAVPINKLYAGAPGNPSNSTGGDVATSVNALIDASILSELTVTELSNSKANSIHTHDTASISSAGFISASDKQKLDSLIFGATSNSSDSFLLNRSNHTGTQDISSVMGLQLVLDNKADTSHVHSLASTSTNGFMSSLDKTKLNYIATNASANQSDVFLLSRSNHTGFQPLASITGLQTALDAKANSVHTHSVATTSVAGFMSASDKSKLDNITGGSSPDSFLLSRTNHTGVQAISTVTGLQDALDLKSPTSHGHLNATASVAGFMSTTDKAKLDTISANAKATNTDAFLLFRTNHTGTQAISTILGLESALSAKQPMLVAGTNISIDPLTWTISSTGGGSSGTSDHSALINRNASNQHTIAAITGLQGALDTKAEATHYHPEYIVNLTTGATDATAGRVLRLGDARSPTGDYRLGGVDSTTPDNTTDWNTITGLGVYKQTLRGTNANGMGGSTDYIVEVLQANATNLVQIAHPLTIGASSASFVRAQVGGVWGTWRRIIDNGNLSQYVQSSSTDATEGKLMAVGAFGLGSTAVSVSGANVLNGLVSTGFYKILGSNVAGSGAPAGAGGGVIQHIYFDSNYSSQIYRDVSSVNPTQWIRHKNNGTWTAWSLVWNGSNLVKQVNAMDSTAGAMLSVGAFGLGNAGNGIGVTNCDDVALPTGLYAINNATTGTKPAGVTTVMTLLVQRFSATAVSQIVVDATNNRVYCRNYITSAWTAWREIWTSGNLVKQTSTTDATAGSVLTVGAFGLGLTTGLNLANIDSVTTPTGMYNCVTATTGTKPGGFTTNMTVLVQTYDADQVTQLLTETTTGRMFFRVYALTVWTAWQEIWSTNNLVKQTSLYDTTNGRVLTVGAGGLLGNAQDAGFTDDANGINITGFFRTTPTMLNIPAAVLNGSLLANYQRDISNQYQEIFERNSDTRHYRRKFDGTWQAWRQVKLTEDPADETYRATNAAYTVVRKGKITRVQVTCDATNFTLTIPTGYLANDRVELSASVAAGRVVTITSSASMTAVGGTAGISHTITGQAHLNIVMVFNGTDWQLTVT